MDTKCIFDFLLKFDILLKLYHLIFPACFENSSLVQRKASEFIHTNMFINYSQHALAEQTSKGSSLGPAVNLADVEKVK